MIKRSLKRFLRRLHRHFPRTTRRLVRSILRVRRSFRRLGRRISSWLPDFTHTLWFTRAMTAFFILVVIPSLGLVAINTFRDRRYNLSEDVLSMVGASTVEKTLIKDEADKITYNRADEASPLSKEQVLELAGREEDSTGKRPYQAELSKNPGEGITFSDGSGERSFTLTPKFGISGARLDDGRVIYPKGGNEKHIYSFKKNGIKSDIVLLEQPADDTHTYEWELQLPSTLEARITVGNVGIYSADPLLFGAQAGDQKSQDLLKNAQENGAKNTLIFELPKPFILDSNEQTNYQDVSYSLKDNVLTLTAKNLKNQTYPLTIDPTITVSTTSDFQQKIGDTGNIDYGTDGEIRRGDIGGSPAVAGTSTQATMFTPSRYGHRSVTYNGYLYVIGGSQGGSADTDCNSSSSVYCSDINYCPISTSDGSIGTCVQQIDAFTNARRFHTSVVYNGFLYIIGGYNGTANENDIQYCPINSNGSVGTCTRQTSAFTQSRQQHTSAVYNGYLYIIGGDQGTADTDCNASSSSKCTDINYCPIKSDGSVGSCTQQVSGFTTGRSGHTSIVLNGFLYVIGGCTSGGCIAYANDIQYCPINSNGSTGTCTQQAAAFTTARYGHTSVVHNGNLYIAGGYSGSLQNDIQFCPINSNGSAGTCTQQTSAFTTTRTFHASVVYNGYLYILGGHNNSTTYYNDIQRAIIGQGRPGPSTQQTTAFTTTRWGHTSVVHNGNVYIIGGSGSGTGCSAYCDDIQFSSINSNGSLSCPSGFTCTTGVFTQQTSAFTTARRFHGSIVNNGYLYIIGGEQSGGTAHNDVQYCPINSNGSVGSCTQQTNSFTTARYEHKTTVYNGYVYITGGRGTGTGCTSNKCNDIQFSSINSNGSLSCPSGFTCTTGVFAQQTSAFTTERQDHETVAYNGYLYVIGGNGTGTGCVSSYCSDIQYCPINSNGSVGACTQQTNAFTPTRSFFSAEIRNGYLYLVGGANASFHNDIQYCPINTNGSAGTCTQKSSGFSTARRGQSSVIYNGYLYIIGGIDSSSNVLNDAQRVQIAATNAGQGSTTQQSSAFTTARQGHTSVVYNGYLYIIGGGAGVSYYNDIQYCAIDASGSVGSCTQQTTAFTNARRDHTSFVNNGYLYIVGGYTNSQRDDILFSSINSNGSLSCPSGFSCSVGVFTQQTSAFTTARSEHSSVVYNNNLYIIGGYGTGTGCSSFRCSDIQYCPINSNGSVGSCVQQTSAFTTARAYHTSVVYNGYLYIIGGESNPTVQNDIQYCPINSNGSVGTCVRQTMAFAAARYGHSSIVHNDYLYIVGGHDGGSYQNDIQYCPINSNGSVGGCTQQTSAFTTARSGQTSVASNGFLYIIGGGNGSEFNDIQYIPLKTPAFIARYERLIDTTHSANTAQSFTINGTAVCSYTVTYKLAGSNNIFGSETVIPSVLTGVSQNISSGTNTRYILIVATLNDSTCGGTSSITSITLTYDSVSSPPTLLLPSDGFTAVGILPEFRLGSSDESSTYLRYKIEACSTSNCSAIVRTIDQTSSQTGWNSQSQQSGTAYSSGITGITQYAAHQYQTTALSANTQYWWRGYAKDPAGTNNWSDASSIRSFTTGEATPENVNIGGGTTIYGGTNFSTGN